MGSGCSMCTAFLFGWWNSSEYGWWRWWLSAVGAGNTIDLYTYTQWQRSVSHYASFPLTKKRWLFFIVSYFVLFCWLECCLVLLSSSDNKAQFPADVLSWTYYFLCVFEALSSSSALRKVLQVVRSPFHSECGPLNQHSSIAGGIQNRTPTPHLLLRFCVLTRSLGGLCPLQSLRNHPHPSMIFSHVNSTVSVFITNFSSAGALGFRAFFPQFYIVYL